MSANPKLIAAADQGHAETKKQVQALTDEQVMVAIMLATNLMHQLAEDVDSCERKCPEPEAWLHMLNAAVCKLGEMMLERI